MKNNDLQRSKYLAFYREIAGHVFSASNSVASYMSLKSTNTDLLKRISELEQEVIAYRQRIGDLEDIIGENEMYFASNKEVRYKVMPAQVVNNSVNREDNLITLNKGAKDGVKIDMGVISTKGIVGVIMSVTPHFSVVIPVLNHKYRLSCKILGSDYFGSLVWEGGNSQFTSLSGLPGHAVYNVGDTVVTNGFSPVFPEGIPVGRIENALKAKSGDYQTLKIRLFTDFSTLNGVFLIENILKDEQLNIEKASSK